MGSFLQVRGDLPGGPGTLDRPGLVWEKETDTGTVFVGLPSTRSESTGPGTCRKGVLSGLRLETYVVRES